MIAVLYLVELTIHTFYSPDVDMINGFKMAAQVALQTIVILSAALVASGRITSNYGEHICVQISLIQIFLAVPEQIWGVVSKTILRKSGPPRESDFKATSAEIALDREKKSISLRFRLKACATVLKSIKYLAPVLKTGDTKGILVEVTIRKKLLLSLEMLQGGKLCVIFEDIFRCKGVRQALEHEMRCRPEISPAVQALLANPWHTSVDFRDGIYHIYKIKAILEGSGGESEILPVRKHNDSEASFVNGNSFGWNSNDSLTPCPVRLIEGASNAPQAPDHLEYSGYGHYGLSSSGDFPARPVDLEVSLYDKWAASQLVFAEGSRCLGLDALSINDFNLNPLQYKDSAAASNGRAGLGVYPARLDELFTPVVDPPQLQPPPYEQPASLVGQSVLVYYHFPRATEMYSTTIASQTVTSQTPPKPTFYPKDGPSNDGPSGRSNDTNQTTTLSTGLAPTDNLEPQSQASSIEGARVVKGVGRESHDKRLNALEMSLENPDAAGLDLQGAGTNLNDSKSLLLDANGSSLQLEDFPSNSEGQFKSLLERVFKAIDSETEETIGEKLMNALPDAMTSLIDDVPENLSAATSLVMLETDPNDEEEGGEGEGMPVESEGGNGADKNKGAVEGHLKYRAESENQEGNITPPDQRRNGNFIQAGINGRNDLCSDGKSTDPKEFIGGAAFGTEKAHELDLQDSIQHRPANTGGKLQRIAKAPIKVAAPVVRKVCGVPWDWFLFWTSAVLALVALFVLTALAKTRCTCSTDAGVNQTAN